MWYSYKYHDAATRSKHWTKACAACNIGGMTRLSIRIDFEGAEAFGPGKVRLLELIGEQGSIRGAAAAMSMSYRHAWLLLQAVEDTFGAPVISTATGGAKGGGAKLTELGKTVVARYRAIEAQAAQAAAGELTELSKAAIAVAPEQRGKKKERAPR
jgi:molybdate transport system regulatory protein